jgi:hypothetical protein
MRNYIPDGNTEPGYIAERKGIHEACAFKYRRALHSERAKVQDAGGKGNVEFAKAVYRCLEAHVVEWDLKDGEGDVAKPVPVKAVNIARVAPALVDRLFAIVGGYDFSDDVPGATPTAPAGDELDRLVENGNANDAAVENQQKN